MKREQCDYPVRLADVLVDNFAAIMSLEKDVGRHYSRWTLALGSWLGNSPQGFQNMFEALEKSFKVLNLPSDVPRAIDKTIKKLEKQGRLQTLRGVMYGYWLNHHLACGGEMRQATKLFEQITT